jgi:uncharacterized protein
VKEKGYTPGAFFLGLFVCIGLTGLGYLLGTAAIDYKQFDRTVKVKGLSEREVAADIVIWPIQFTAAENDLEQLYSLIDKNTAQIKEFLVGNNIAQDEITVSAPSITDKSAQQYGNSARPEYRYTAVPAARTIWATIIVNPNTTVPVAFNF